MRIRVVKMNKIKLMYLRWKNTSKWYNKKEINKMTLRDVFYGIKLFALCGFIETDKEVE